MMRAIAALRVTIDGGDALRKMTYVAAFGFMMGALEVAFGLFPVGFHGPLHAHGVMMPTCGATRAVYYTMAGAWGTAWRYNPLGPLLVAGAALTLVRYFAGVFTGRWITPRITWNPLVWALLAVGTVALEIHQQAHAALLMGP